MMYSKGAIKPFYEVMQQAGEKVDQNAYVPAVAGYYSTAKGLMSLTRSPRAPVIECHQEISVTAQAGVVRVASSAVTAQALRCNFIRVILPKKGARCYQANMTVSLHLRYVRMASGNQAK